MDNSNRVLRLAVPRCILLVPGFHWSLYFLDLQIFNKLSWSPELWGGAIFLSGLCSLGLSILSSPSMRANDV
jgi:hypothetical protein